MFFIRSLVFKCCARIVVIILLLSEIMPTYSRCVLKGLVYVVIIAPLGCQPSFYAKYTKLNIHSSCDIRLVSNTKYTCLMRFCVL